MKWNSPLILLLSLCSVTLGTPTPPTNVLQLQPPAVALKHVNFTLGVVLPFYDLNGSMWPDFVNFTVTYKNSGNNWSTVSSGQFNTTDEVFQFRIPQLRAENFGDNYFNVSVGGYQGQFVIYAVPAWTSLMPPLATLLFAVIFKQVLIALLLGIWVGSTFVYKYNAFTALLRTFDTYFVNSLSDPSHAGVVVFTFLLGGLIGVVNKSGGAEGLAQLAAPFTSSKRRAQLAVWILGLLIFFDDYSSVLIIGNSLRPIVQRVQVSPEKFAFLVHAVGSSLPSFAPVSSWIAVELGYISAEYSFLGIKANPFVVFLQTIPYRFFPILMIVFCFLLVVGQRDFGPMLTIERKERGPVHHIELQMADGEEQKPIPKRWFNAFIPFLVVIVIAFIGMYFDGLSALEQADPNLPRTLINIFTYSNSMNALIWASAAGAIVAVVLILVQRIFTLSKTMDAVMAGINDVLGPTLVLILAWALGQVIADVQTAAYLVGLIGGHLPLSVLPTLITAVAYLVSFACGTAFDTHAVLLAVSSVLSGAIFGNVCSPIADNTILTALATHCDLEAHVKTLLPYSLLVGFVAIVGGTLPVGFGMPVWAGLPVCCALLTLLYFFLGGTPRQPSLFSRIFCRCKPCRSGETAMLLN